MGQTIQTAIGFVFSFFIILCFIVAGPLLYAQVNISATVFHSYKEECLIQSALYDTQHICVDDYCYEAVFTSPEKMHFLMRSFSDVIVLVVEGVKAL